MNDAIGQKITPGDIVLYTNNSSSGYDIAIVKKLGKGNTVTLTSSYPSRKDRENIIVISEEKLISYFREMFTRNTQDAEGLVAYNEYNAETDRYQVINLPIEDVIQKRARNFIHQHRIIKGIPFGLYEPTNVEKIVLEKSLK